MTNARTRHESEPQQLRVFAALSRHLNMRRTAHELDLDISAVSRSLAALEQRWGRRLFERQPRGLVATPAGRELLPLAEAVLDRLQHLDQRLQAGLGTDLPSGPLRLGVAPTVAQEILPLAVREFRETCPGLGLHIEPCTTRDAAAALLADRLDLAVVVPPAHLDGLVAEPLAEEDLHVVVHPLHPWAVARRAQLGDPRSGRLILPDRRDATRLLIEEYLREDGHPVEPALEIAGEECIPQFVRLDLGVGFLPRWVVATEVENGRLTLLPTGRRRLRRQWTVLRPRSRPLRFSEHLLASICGTLLRDRIARDP